MHAAAIVEKQGFVVAPPCTDDMEVEAACADDLLGGDIEQCHTIIADNQQLATVMDVLQTEGSADLL